ncbi:Na+/H+ antiporter NhaA [Glycomyces rhizosphaerae]|uniref:Na+/H+ antiporter NhaA n=1 Tax=Glycomyces rhizosphaerae TaxID=2054422 RepID=A0ABV7PVP0_9ACTN
MRLFALFSPQVRLQVDQSQSLLDHLVGTVDYFYDASPVVTGDRRLGSRAPIASRTNGALRISWLALFGSRIPSAARVFLLTLAIVDDLGAIAVIAVFYTEEVSLGWLTAAGRDRAAPAQRLVRARLPHRRHRLMAGHARIRCPRHHRGRHHVPDAVVVRPCERRCRPLR